MFLINLWVQIPFALAWVLKIELKISFSIIKGISHGSYEVNIPMSPVPESMHLLALQRKSNFPVLRVSEHFPFTLNPGGATGSLFGIGVLATPPFVGPL